MFVIILVFLAIAFYMLYIKYSFKYNNIEGLDNTSLKEIIYNIASDKNDKISDINKLTAIQNTLLTSEDASNIPLQTTSNISSLEFIKDTIKKSIKQKKTFNNFITLPPDKRSAKMASLTNDISEENKPLMDALTPGVANQINLPEKEFTFTEQIFIILNNEQITDTEKIKKIMDLTYIQPVVATTTIPVKKANRTTKLTDVNKWFRRKKKKK
jgi:hypothetical protein